MENLQEQRIQLDRLQVEAQLAGFGLRKQEQPAHQAGEPARFLVDAGERLFVELLHAAHQVHIALDHRQRRAQFMAHVGQEPAAAR